MTVGDTDKLAFEEEELPIKVVNAASEYHFQTAPEPRLPPDCVIVVLLPEHIGEVEAAKEVAAVELDKTEMLAVPVSEAAVHPLTSVTEIGV